jgi:1,2-dihydroxy-3-keto-5-methylthiopentene dioxygenase
MALVTIAEQNKTLSDLDEIRSCLLCYGIDYQRWTLSNPVAPDAPADEVLRAYSREIEELKASGGYVTADVIDVAPDTPGLDEMLAKFNREHWHDEDEVRFMISGHGLFHVHTKADGVVAIEVEAGDLIRVPRGTRHWFHLCQDRHIRAIRLFQDIGGWTPHYTDSMIEADHVPVCFGVSHVPPKQTPKTAS